MYEKKLNSDFRLKNKQHLTVKIHVSSRNICSERTLSLIAWSFTVIGSWPFIFHFLIILSFKLSGLPCCRHVIDNLSIAFYQNVH